MTDPWRAGQFKNGYTAEYLPRNTRTFLMLKEDGKPIVFDSRRDALMAAKAAHDLENPPARPVGASLQQEAQRFMQRRRD